MCQGGVCFGSNETRSCLTHADTRTRAPPDVTDHGRWPDRQTLPRPDRPVPPPPSPGRAPVGLDGVGVGQQQVVAARPLAPVALALSGRKGAVAVLVGAHHPGLVEAAQCWARGAVRGLGAAEAPRLCTTYARRRAPSTRTGPPRCEIHSPHHTTHPTPAGWRLPGPLPARPAPAQPAGGRGELAHPRALAHPAPQNGSTL